MMAELAKSGKPDSPELEAAVRERLVTGEILMQEADKRGLTAQPDVQLQLEAARQQVLVAALAQQYFQANPPTDDELHAAYDSVSKANAGKEYHAHHILVDTLPQANAIIAKLKKGGDFEAIAKAESKDPESAVKGGDLDWARQSDLDPAFFDAMSKIPKGKYTLTPVKTQFGYHIIRLDDVREQTIPSFDEVKPKLIELVTQDQKWQEGRFRAMLADLRAKAKVE